MWTQRRRPGGAGSTPVELAALLILKRLRAAELPPDAEGLVARLAQNVDSSATRHIIRKLYTTCEPAATLVRDLAKVMEDLKDIPGPKLLHVVTRKGAGYAPSEAGSPTKWHAPGLFNKDTGEILKSADAAPKPPKFQDVFGRSIIELAKKDRPLPRK